MTKWIAAALMSFPLLVSANPASDALASVMRRQNEIVRLAAADKALDWAVGDENNYKVDIGFIKGVMQNKVTSVSADGIWLEQNVDLGFAGQQKVQTLLDPETGDVKRQIVDGREQEPAPSKIEVIEVKQERITVPAGTFDTLHAKMRDLVSSQDFDMWINSEAVPLSGLVKSVEPTSAGPATVSLTSFRRH